MSEDDLQRFIDLALKTGRIYCARDVFAALWVAKTAGKDRRLDGLELVECWWLPPGEALAVDHPPRDLVIPDSAIQDGTVAGPPVLVDMFTGRVKEAP